MFLFGMVIYRNIRVQNNENNNVSIDEVKKIEEKLSCVYLWKEITGEALPAFQNINSADDKWVWEVVKNNLENYEVSYEDIMEEAKLIFGDNFNKEFPREGNSSFSFNNEINKYIAIEVEFDQEEDAFLLDNIKKVDETGYEVEIIEYLEDYSSKDSVAIRNTSDDEIGRVALSESETKMQDIVKNNKDRFSKKKVFLKNENDRLIIERVEKC